MKNAFSQPLAALLLTGGLLASSYMGCTDAGVENHTNYDLTFSDTLPPLKSPHELSVNDTIPVPELPGNFSEEAAMELVYGLYDKEIECSKWVCTVQEKPKFQGKMSESGHLFSRSAGFYPFRNGEEIGVYLITETLERTSDGWEDCHACAPILGAAEFTHEDDRWVVKSLKKELGQLGAWGALPQGQLIRLGENQFGILFEGGYTSQGISTGECTLLAVADGQFRVLVSTPTAFSNEGFFENGLDSPGAYAYDSKLRFEQNDKPFFDLIVETTGTRPLDNAESGEVLPFRESRRYTYQNGKYMLSDSVASLLR